MKYDFGFGFENGNSDGKTGRLVWKCVSDHFLTTTSVVLFVRGKKCPEATTFGVKTKIKNSEIQNSNRLEGYKMQ